MYDKEIDLGIDPKPINETESRQLELLLNFLRNKRGISFKKIRQIMPHFYNNENQFSDEKKFHRDLEELKELGFTIKYYHSHLENPSNLGNVYKIEINESNPEINFTENELKILSSLIYYNFESEKSETFYSISQKIFSKNLNYFPDIKKLYKIKSKENPSINNEIFYRIVQAIKDKTPLKIQYKKNFFDRKELREIEPIELVKKGIIDFYIIAFDRDLKKFRKFILQKIDTIQEMPGIYIHSKKPTAEERNFHPLGFLIHEPEIIQLQIEDGDLWKIKNFLAEYSFSQSNNLIEFSTTNLQALCDFFISEPEIIFKTSSKKFITLFENFLSEIQSNYTNSEKFL